MGVSPNKGYLFFRVPIVRTVVFLGLYWGAPMATTKRLDFENAQHSDSASEPLRSRGLGFRV